MRTLSKENAKASAGRQALAAPTAPAAAQIHLTVRVPKIESIRITYYGTMWMPSGS